MRYFKSISRRHVQKHVDGYLCLEPKPDKCSVFAMRCRLRTRQWCNNVMIYSAPAIRTKSRCYIYAGYRKSCRMITPYWEHVCLCIVHNLISLKIEMSNNKVCIICMQFRIYSYSYTQWSIHLRVISYIELLILQIANTPATANAQMCLWGGIPRWIIQGNNLKGGGYEYKTSTLHEIPSAHNVTITFEYKAYCTAYRSPLPTYVKEHI